MPNDNEKLNLADKGPSAGLSELAAELAAVSGASHVQLHSWNPTICLADFSSVAPADDARRIEVAMEDQGAVGSAIFWNSTVAVDVVKRSPAWRAAKLEMVSAAQRERRREISSFLSGLLHDVRGPWRRISTTTALLPAEELTPATLREILDEETRDIDILLRSAQKVGDALAPVEDESSELRAAWDGAVHRYVSQHRSTPVNWIVDLPDGSHVRAPESDVAEVFCQLIDNTMKYSGSTDACVRYDGMQSGGHLIRFWDTGCGVETEFIRKLFAPFYRAYAGPIPGHGLGLFVCRNLIRRAGGRIDIVPSREGHGLTFEIWLPAAGRGGAPAQAGRETENTTA